MDAGTEYKKWAVEMLTDYLSNEDERRRNLEAKAVVGSSGLLVILGVLVSGSGTPASCSVPWWLSLGGHAVTCATAVLAAFILRARTSFGIDPRQFASPEVLRENVEKRYDDLLKHLNKVLERVDPELRRIGIMVGVCQWFALAGSVLYVLSILAAMLGVGSSGITDG